MSHICKKMEFGHFKIQNYGGIWVMSVNSEYYESPIEFCPYCGLHKTLLKDCTQEEYNTHLERIGM